VQTVLITGAGRGLGLELARQYAADGWRVLATRRGESQALVELAARFPSRVLILTLDVTSSASVAALARQLAIETIDVLINNAGYMAKTCFGPEVTRAQSLESVDLAEWEQTLRVNVLAPVAVTRALLENLVRSDQAKVITFSSFLGSIQLNTLGGLYAYRSSKSAVNSIMKSMGIDLGRRGIVAAAIHPGWARTDMGGAGADVDATTAVAGVRQVIAGLTLAQAGQVWTYDGKILPY
jgi:NAD(P)-dependent dehydrogenase (short-subunit alcohol dehydrogenase family)